MARLNRPVSRRQTHWLLASALAAFLPLTPYLPLWLSAGAGAMFLWRGLLNWRQWRQPPRILMVLLVFIGVGAVLFQYRSLMGRTPGVSMLAIFLSLKLLELRSARDAIASALLCYFLVLGQFLFTQTL
ncbi:MAG TPA: transglutaminaseTgpA domain-containing protein, partial [Rhodocyclaceae bacterium]|nr:transglutaminaseTgpA domain-containing protein [Rhodocyclaceae bacterium]